MKACQKLPSANSTDNQIDNRINNIVWQGISHLSDTNTAKHPRYFLLPITADTEEPKRHIYFVNNTDETLDFVAPFEVMATTKLGSVVMACPAKQTTGEAQIFYRDVMPNQGVRIDTQYSIYDSDSLCQYTLYTSSRESKAAWGVWRFKVVEKGCIKKPYPLLWGDFTKPSAVVSIEQINTCEKRPILPTVYKLRDDYFDTLAQSTNKTTAEFIIAINDIIYVYDFAPVGCYFNHLWDEFSTEAYDIAKRIIKKDPKSWQDVSAIMSKTFDEWFYENACTIPQEVAQMVLQLWVHFKGVASDG